MRELRIGRPPVEERVVPDVVGLLLEGKTALGLHLLQAGEIGEADIGQWLVGERPEVLGRLQLRRVGGQEEEMDTLGYLHLLPGMPPGSIQHQGNPFHWSCSHIPSKGSQHLTEENRRDGRQEPPLGLTGGRTDEATDIQPLVPLLDGRNRSLPDRCPHLSDQGQEANPVLIGRPKLDLRSWVGTADLVYLIGELS